jgi:2-phospho-L-lactate/phosphoenolpyruvate guanylyltransferase
MKRTTWAIVPVKRLSQAKRRLAPVLPAHARRQLVIAMLQDVLAALVQVREIDRVLVVTPDAQVAEIARAAGAAVLSEARSAGLNAAVKTGLAHARGHGATNALVLPADVPLATPDELRRIVMSSHGGAQPRALLAPSHDGEGTNALLLSPPDILQPSFGPGSFLRHLAQAVARKVELQIVQPAGLARDIDEPRDLDQLMGYKRGSARYAFLEAHVHKAESRPENPSPGTEP